MMATPSANPNAKTALYRFGGTDGVYTAKVWKMDTVDMVSEQLLRHIMTFVLPLSMWPPGLVPLVVGYAATDGEWTQLTDMPHTRVMATAALVHGHIYIAGSTGSGFTLTTNFERYDLHDRLWWTTQPTFQPGPLSSHQQVVPFLDNLYFIGGAQPYKCHVFNPVDNSCTSAPDTRADHRGGSTVVCRGRMYTFGGGGSGRSFESESFDPDTRTWTPISAIPKSILYPMAIVLPNDQSIAIMDKSALNDGSAPDCAVQLYDVPTNSWSVATWQLPKGTGNSTSMHVRGMRLFVIGAGSEGRSTFAMDFGIDPLGWVTGPDLPQAAVCSYPAYI